MNYMQKLKAVRQFIRNTTSISYEGDIYLSDVEQYLDELIEISGEVLGMAPIIDLTSSNVKEEIEEAMKQGKSVSGTYKITN